MLLADVPIDLLEIIFARELEASLSLHCTCQIFFCAARIRLAGDAAAAILEIEEYIES